MDALPSILKYGMSSFDELQKKGIEVTTGEYQTRIAGKNRKFISFTDSIATALLYTSLEGKNEENKDGSFGVMIGIAPESVQEFNLAGVLSDVREIGIMENIPLRHIKVLTVPKEKVDFVKKMVGELDIEVVGAEMQDSFYRMSTVKKIEYLMKPEKNEQYIPNEYTKETMANNARKGRLSRLMGLFNKILNNRVERHGEGRKEKRATQYGEDGR